MMIVHFVLAIVNYSAIFYHLSRANVTRLIDRFEFVRYQTKRYQMGFIKCHAHLKIKDL